MNGHRSKPMMPASPLSPSLQVQLHPASGAAEVLERETKRPRLSPRFSESSPQPVATNLPPLPTATAGSCSSSGEAGPSGTSTAGRVHLRLRGVSPTLAALHEALGTVPLRDEPKEDAIRFAYQAVASHLRPLIRDRCSYHIIDDAAFRALLAELPSEHQPPGGAILQV